MTVLSEFLTPFHMHSLISKQGFHLYIIPFFKFPDSSCNAKFTSKFPISTLCSDVYLIYVTGFVKIVPIGTTTEIHFMA